MEKQRVPSGGVKFVAALVIVLAVAATFLYASDPLFWKRYFTVRSMHQYLRHPFPTPEFFYPQETVKGVAHAQPFPVAATGERTLSDDFIGHATAIAQSYRSTSLVYLQDGRIQFAGYWPQSVEHTRVQAFSMAKTVCALLVGIAIEQRLIKSVDDPIGHYLAEWAGDDRGRRITIRNLLNMSSGLESSPMISVNPFSKSQQRQIGTHLLKTTLDHELAREPGVVFNYNGVDVTLLGLIISRTSGMRYAQFMSKYLWQPLGNEDAALWLDHEGGLPRTFIGLYATTMDWVRLGKLMLDHGRLGDRQIVPSSWIDQMTTPSKPAPYYGFFTWLGERTKPPAPGTTPEFYRFIGLGGQWVVVVPRKNLVIVRTGPIDTESIESHITEMIPQ